MHRRFILWLRAINIYAIKMELGMLAAQNEIKFYEHISLLMSNLKQIPDDRWKIKADRLREIREEIERFEKINYGVRPA